MTTKWELPGSGLQKNTGSQQPWRSEVLLV